MAAPKEKYQTLQCAYSLCVAQLIWILVYVGITTSILKIRQGSFIQAYFFPYAHFCVAITPDGKGVWPVAPCKQSLAFYFGMFQLLSWCF